LSWGDEGEGEDDEEIVSLRSRMIWVGNILKAEGEERVLFKMVDSTSSGIGGESGTNAFVVDRWWRREVKDEGSEEEGSGLEANDRRKGLVAGDDEVALLLDSMVSIIVLWRGRVGEGARRVSRVVAVVREINMLSVRWGKRRRSWLYD
jgi:hypothetical protein